MLHLWGMKSTQANSAPAPSLIRRWLSLGLLAAVSAACYALGLQNYFTLQSIAEHQSQLQTFVSQNLFLAAAIYFIVYVAVVALSLPGAALLSIQRDMKNSFEEIATTSYRVFHLSYRPRMDARPATPTRKS